MFYLRCPEKIPCAFSSGWNEGCLKNVNGLGICPLCGTVTYLQYSFITSSHSLIKVGRYGSVTSYSYNCRRDFHSRLGPFAVDVKLGKVICAISKQPDH